MHLNLSKLGIRTIGVGFCIFLNANCSVAHGQPVTLPTSWEEMILLSPRIGERLPHLGVNSGDYDGPVTDERMTLKRACNLFLSKHYDEAIKEYERVPCESLYPVNVNYAFYERIACGLAYEKLGKFADALVTYERMDRLEAKANLLVRLGRFSEAKEIANAKLDKMTMDSINYVDTIWLRIRAAADAGLGNDKAAVKDLTVAATYTNGFPDSAVCVTDANGLIDRSKLGKRLVIAEREDKTLLKDTEVKTQDYLAKKEALRITDDDESESLSEGVRAQLDTIIQNTSKEISKDDKFPDGFRDRARALKKLGKYSDALSDANRAIELGGRPYLRERAAIYSRMGDYKSAIKDLIASLNDRTPGPETKETWLKLAGIYIKSKQYSDAIHAANNAMIGSRERAQAYFLRAKAEAGLGKTSEARSDCNIAMSECFEHANIIFRDSIQGWMQALPEQ